MTIKETEIPITFNGIIKWGGLAAGAVSLIVSLVLLVVKLDRQSQTLRDQYLADKSLLELKIDNNTRDIDILKAKAVQAERDISDINRKLDVAVAILARIENKFSATNPNQ